VIDENAYGFLLSWFDLEDVEYSVETEQFVEHYRRLKGAFQSCLDTLPLGRGVTVLDLGHAFYVEVGEGEESTDPIRWLREVRAKLSELDFTTFAVVCHGGRWVENMPAEQPATEVRIVSARLPSEPLRKALAAEVAAHSFVDEGEGWGPGLYVESDVIEALGRKLKNAPTALLAADSQFYRVGA
jgi:hypothetical protein